MSPLNGAPDRAAARVTLNLSPREAYTLVQKLASDDDFRSRLERDPYAVLAEHGVYLPPGTVTGEVRLPTKEAVRDASERFTLGQPVEMILDAVPDLIIFFFFIV